jgi:hypothetical protein
MSLESDCGIGIIFRRASVSPINPAKGQIDLSGKIEKRLELDSLQTLAK